MRAQVGAMTILAISYRGHETKWMKDMRTRNFALPREWKPDVPRRGRATCAHIVTLGGAGAGPRERVAAEARCKSRRLNLMINVAIAASARIPDLEPLSFRIDSIKCTRQHAMSRERTDGC